MAADFVHLHVHSEFSMLDASIRLPDLIRRCEALEMPAVALTDSANMYGAVQLHKLCKGGSVRPILGAELNLVEGDRGDARARRTGHLVVLASSQVGYQNVVRLVSRGWVDGLVQGIPRIDFELLAEHAEGVVGLSACLGGYLAQRILMEGPEAGREAMGKLAEIFGRDHFYVELQDHGFPESRPLNEILVEQAKALALPIVATNDCHYLEREQAQAQLSLQCIGTGRMLREMEALHHHSSEMYLKSPEQMVELFRHHPDAVRNTLVVAEMCAGQADPISEPKLPRFAVPEGQTEGGWLRRLSAEGLGERLREKSLMGEPYDEPAYRARLEMELDVIEQMGFPGYFLIVQDFINWAKHNDVPVGPGRGSGAGSIVAWALRITDLDPIPYGLLFERFLNPERVSMPDFDVDFCMDKRDSVINYVREKYGHASVGQIATFHQLKSKSCVRDVARVMGISPAEAGRIAGMIPELGPGKSAPIADAIRDTPRLKEIYESDEEMHQLLDTAHNLENLTRHAGMHAAGVVISEGPIWDHVPVFCPEEGTYVTQYHKDDVEAAGLVKFDFLGLRTLTVIDIATKLIDRRPERQGEPFRIDRIPLDDEATFALLRSGETTNVFQLESSGMQGLFKQLKPDRFEDIIAAVALYRPGPMGAGMDKDFVERKHGRQAVSYPDPCLEKILEPTRGVIVYQEQVMQIAQVMGGYSLGGADLLRRAMGKKKAEEMEKQKAFFIEGATGKGFAQAKAEEVFDLMAFFAGYGFNKSHSAAYALIAYQTAFLKTHFPAELLCATLTADKDKIDKVVRTVNEARSMGVTVLPPDVNESEVDFTVVYAEEADASIRRRPDQPVCSRGKLRDPFSPRIRFGLGAIKGVGGAALEAILESRRGNSARGAEPEEPEEQPFVDLFDFCSRVDLRRVNKSVAEALVQCGAFDAAHEGAKVSRAGALGAVESAFERGKRMAAERASGQTSIFGLLGAEEAAEQVRIAGIFPDAEPWDLGEILAREKASLGFYVSGHPLDRYARELGRLANASTESLATLSGGQAIVIGGSVEGYRERRTKTGGDMAFFFLEDPHGRVEVIVRPRNLEGGGIRETLKGGEPILLTAKVKHEVERGNEAEDAPVEVKLLLESAQPLASVISEQTRSISVRLGVDEIDRDKLDQLRRTLEGHPGPCSVSLELIAEGWRVLFDPLGPNVDPSEALKSNVDRLFGESVCSFH